MRAIPLTSQAPVLISGFLDETHHVLTPAQSMTKRASLRQHRVTSQMPGRDVHGRWRKATAPDESRVSLHQKAGGLLRRVGGRA